MNNPPQESKERCETCDKPICTMHPTEDIGETYDMFCHCSCQPTDEEEGWEVDIRIILTGLMQPQIKGFEISRKAVIDWIKEKRKEWDTQSKLSGLKTALELKDISVKGANCGSEHVDQWGEAIKAKITKLEEEVSN